MRFTTWNLHAGDAAAKLAALPDAPDVAVLCEVQRAAPQTPLGGVAPDWKWVGALAKRGLALASWIGDLDIAAPISGLGGRYSLAAVTDVGLGILGIWSCPEGKSPSPADYAAQIHGALDAHETLLRTRPCIVAGDFNIDCGGKTDTRWGITARLQALGYQSAYHSHFGVAPGDEAHHTHFHQFNSERPFHIDLVFLHPDLLATVQSVKVGQFDAWVAASAVHRSDHVPVTVELNLD